MGKNDEEQYLTPAEAAKLTGLTPDALRARANSRSWAVIRTVGGHRRYRRSDVEAAEVPANGRRQAERERRGRGSQKAEKRAQKRQARQQARKR